MRRRSKTLELGAGDAVGPYVIEDLLGEGGMGLVYKARDESGTLVALKLIRPGFAGDERFRRRFERERDAASRVEHRNVVPIVGSGEHDGVPYIAQRFIAGGSLEQRISARGRLDVPELVRIVRHAAAGLDALHSTGVIHRDVKPGNILLDEDGRAYITDFGLAKPRDASVLTRPKQTVGSVDYMAPEQIRGKDVGPPTDVYALGCVTVERLTGRPPFADSEGMQALWAHLQDTPPDLSTEREDVGAELGWAISKALEKEPGDRPPTPVAYARMLDVAASSAASG